MVSSIKNVIVRINKGLKVNDNNCDIRSLKIQLVLEVEVHLEVIINAMNEHDAENRVEHRCEFVAYTN